MKSLVTGSWSWNGFARSLLIGAITGGTTGGFLGMYSATGFNGAVVLGSMNGAVSGGVEAIFSGENFFKGLYSGAIMGGAMAGLVSGISWTMDKLFNNYEYRIDEMLVNDNNTVAGTKEADFNIDTVKNIANSPRYKNQFIKGNYHIVDGNSDLSEGLISKGYTFDSSSQLLDGPRGKAWGLTETVTHNNKLVYQRIYLPKGTFVSIEQLDLTMGHEIFHSILNNARLYDIYTLDGLNGQHSVHEHFISEWENKYVKFRKWQMLKLDVQGFDNTVLGDIGMKGLIDKIKPIFNNYLKSTLK